MRQSVSKTVQWQQVLVCVAELSRVTDDSPTPAGITCVAVSRYTRSRDGHATVHHV